MRNRVTWIIVCVTTACLCLTAWIFVSKRSVLVSATVKTVSQKQIYAEGGLSALPENDIEFSEDKRDLGKALFGETKLSQTNSVSCNSCHDLGFYGADSKPFSIGINGSLGTANAPTVFNAVFNFRQFWDGRANSLNDQIAGPIHNPKEMGSSWPEIVDKLNRDPAYRAKFLTVYGRPADEESVIDAIVSFESTQTTPNSPFDRYLKGDHGAMTAQQVEGFHKFQSFGCVACHQGANVGGNMYQTLGIMGDYFKDRGGNYASDLGRFAVTGNPSDMHVFRVPSLRNVAMTPPYFHDGQVQSLDRAVELMARYQLGRTLSKSDVGDLVSFLNSLTGERPKNIAFKRGVAGEATH